MDAFVQPQDRSARIGPRFDYLALAPAAAAHLLPFSSPGLSCRRRHAGRNAFGLAIVGATLILAVAFVVPFLALALACRPDRQSRGAAARLCRRGGPNALCLSWRRSGADS